MVPCLDCKNRVGIAVLPTLIQISSLWMELCSSVTGIGARIQVSPAGRTLSPSPVTNSTLLPVLEPHSSVLQAGTKIHHPSSSRDSTAPAQSPRSAIVPGSAFLTSVPCKATWMSHGHIWDGAAASGGKCKSYFSQWCQAPFCPVLGFG